MKRILIIDDDEGFRGFLKDLLKKKGYHVQTATSGVDALDLIRGESPDLVITDIIMPDMDGLELIRTLRADNSDVRIVAVSGGGRVNPGLYLGMATKLKADAILKKPFKNSELLELIDSQLSHN